MWKDEEAGEEERAGERPVDEGQPGGECEEVEGPPHGDLAKVVGMALQRRTWANKEEDGRGAFSQRLGRGSDCSK